MIDNNDGITGFAGLREAEERLAMTEAPAFGASLSAASTSPMYKGDAAEYRVRYFVGSALDTGDVLQLEHLMTEGLKANSDPLGQSTSNIYIISEDKTFTKDGDYMVAIKYMERVEKTVIPDEELAAQDTTDKE